MRAPNGQGQASAFLRGRAIRLLDVRDPDHRQYELLIDARGLVASVRPMWPPSSLNS
ncbi:MAG: hypothetical protein MK209_10070 [Planctomycetes bacterium]|nr:hypothetical protein [Planctomycetota bacterium]